MAQSFVHDMELMTQNGKNRTILCSMDAFEGRSAGGGRKPAQQQQPGYLTGPAQAQALYSVRWVQAPKEKASVSGPPRSTGTKPGAVKKLNMHMELPEESGGNCAIPVRMSGKYGL